ncbi:hypothetical protein [Synechococcus elongatus]|nr:hypothetical protein [Synechococcus elongatus]UOW75986.1 hypothetical protein PCC6301pg_0783 [Synechococcus elongatus PCC 6301]MBD2588646.1 hypothetical protein [Synechococcus elongatus FACHB-242]MBD2689765.1 hypothetical protein [Synechococcus elongatus FACHB-1061]MBD2708372.1 hypothetical protein [Synechococcus elongatus PCC 7942 = FACHB-805]UOW70544.1 hypothetical protein PCC7943_0783 [Synechococcus elongatus PCC 7943]
MIILSKLTGWSLEEILDLDTDDFLEWLSEARVVEEETARQVRNGR